jgi:hypothetical protein
VRTLADTTPSERDAIGARARARVLARDTAEHRAAELESHVHDALAAA